MNQSNKEVPCTLNLNKKVTGVTLIVMNIPFFIVLCPSCHPTKVNPVIPPEALTLVYTMSNSHF